VVPTAENVARDIWERLEARVSGAGRRLRAVRVHETPDLYVDYFGEPPCSA
jgi:6-pyruvoyl-tetrahydropterin synthase